MSNPCDLQGPEEMLCLYPKHLCQYIEERNSERSSETGAVGQTRLGRGSETGTLPPVGRAGVPVVTASSPRGDIDDLLLRPIWQAWHIHDVTQLLCLWATVLDQLPSLEEREKTTEQLLGRGGIRRTAPETKGRASCGLTWTPRDS